jgi:two-component system, sensor histidine kinase YesM
VKIWTLLRTGVFILMLLALMLKTGLAQVVNPSDTPRVYRKENPVQTSSKRLLKSMEENRSDSQIAESYFDLAGELIKKREYARAESYLLKALALVSNNKKFTGLTVYYRELAKVQETLNKYSDAILHYEKAANCAGNTTIRQININDANRLKNRSMPDTILELLTRNVVLLEQTISPQEQAEAYTRMASANVAKNRPEQAISNYESAINVLDSSGLNTLKVKGELVDYLAETKKFDEAISIQKKVIEISQSDVEVETQVQQIRQLSELYFANESPVEGLAFLQKAYTLASERGNLVEARNTLELLAGYYEKNNNSREALRLYHEFMTGLEGLIAKDSSLIDARLFQATEEKIEQLENEKVLKDELIKRKSRYNSMLVGGLALLCALLALIVKAWFSIRLKNEKIALQSLRREMNPHFLFNSLNSVNQFIASNNEREANKYLTSYSTLMRRMMENSNNDYVSLSTEIEQLTQYLQLEKLRFSEKFDFTIEVDPLLDTDAVKVPNMLIQPNLENAIWHGLRYKDSKGLLNLRFLRSGSKTVAIIEDNGIGLTESRNSKTKNQMMYESRGLKNVQERIKLLNKIYKTDIRFEMSEKTGDVRGVVVTIEW